MALSATQRKLIADLLDIGTGPEPDEFGDYLFQSRKALIGDGIPPDEKSLMLEFLKTMDTVMKKLALFHIGATEAQNQDESQETLQDLTGMWSDICVLLRSPSLLTLKSLNSFVNVDTFLAKVNRLKYLKPHLSHELSSDDEGTSRIKRAKTESAVASIPTSNKFHVLAEEPSTSFQPTPAEEEAEKAVMEELETPEQPANPEPPKKPRVEPIFIALTANYNALIQHLNSHVLKNKVVGKLVGESIKIIPGSPDDYRALTAYLKNNNLNFHAILPKTEKPMKILIKGLGSETNVDDIAAELVGMGFAPMYISALRNRTNGNKLPLFHVTMKQTPGWEKVYDINILQSMYVSVQRFYSTNPKQCYRCQSFGHSSQTCYMPAKCLKCALDHHTKDCTKPRDVKATCVNCKGQHTANYQGCPANPRNKKPQLPFRQRYFQMLKEEKARKKQGLPVKPKPSFRPPDAPLPKIPAWTTRNDKIFTPPGQKIIAPQQQRTAPDVTEEQPIADDQVETAPPTTTRDENRARNIANNQEKYRKLAKQHAEIAQFPTAPTLPAASSTGSGFSEILGAFREFKAIMETIKLKELIHLLKETASKIKAAPNEMDKLAVLLEAANTLSHIFAQS